MIRHSLDMPHFRAINLPCKSPEKSQWGTRSLSNASSAPSPELRQLSPKVVLPTKQSRASRSGPPTDKGDVGQVVAQAHNAIHTSKNKEKKSGSSVSKASRQQAPREKKLMYSIEHSARKRVASSTPLEAKDSDYVPTPAEVADATLSTAPSTPSRRSPRKHASTRPNTASIAFPKPRPKTSAPQTPPQASCALAIKMESSAAGCNLPDPEVGLEPKSPSPSLWSSQLRKEIYQQAGVVELPKAVFEYEEIKKAKRWIDQLVAPFEYEESKKAKKWIDQLVAAKKKDMKAGKRKEKGKCAEQRPAKETNEPNQRDQSKQKIGKKRAGDDMEKDEPCKRQKLLKSRKSNEDTSASKQKRARSSSKAQGHKASVVKTEGRPDMADVPSTMGTGGKNHSPEGSKTMKSQRSLELEVPEERSAQFDDPALESRGQQRIPPNEDWRKPFERRELHLGEGGRTCSCTRLPDFFTRNPYDVPRLATWLATCRGGEPAFFRNVKKITCCQGSVHPLHVINACRKILEEANYSKRWDTDSVVDSAQGILSTNGQDSHNMRRAQSSIPPPVFYGSGGRSRNAPCPGSSSRFMPEMRKATSSLESLAISKPSKGILVRPAPQNTPAKQDRVRGSTSHVAHPVDQLTTPAVARDSNNDPAPPNSPVLGKRHRVHRLTFNVYDDLAPEEEIVAKEQTSNTQPEASNQPQNSFNARRQRHRSVPANLPSRKPIVNELSLSPLPEPQRREGVLQELYNHALLQNMNKSLAPIKKCLKDLTDRFLPPPPAQNPAVAPAPAPILNTAPQPGNSPESSRPRKRKTKPVAERKRRLPELSRDVPAHLRLPDADLIEIGRKSSRYERHRAAPYAFTWHGHLLAEYDYLLGLGGDGWTAKEIKRVSR